MGYFLLDSYYSVRQTCRFTCTTGQRFSNCRWLRVDTDIGESFLKFAVVLLCAAASVFGQSTDSGQTSSSPTPFAGQFFDHDFVNYFIFGNAVYDSDVPTLHGTSTAYGSGVGWEAGGGINAERTLKNGSISFSYRGDYRDYRSANFNGGTDQSLNFSFQKRLNRRWSISVNADGGIMFYGAGFYTAQPSGASGVISNPLSPETRFIGFGLNLSYRQTRRLSYVFGGNYFLNNYTYTSAIGSYGGSGSASLQYETTSKTTIGATYSRTYYTYTGISGQTSIDGASLNLSHRFPSHWQLDLSGGINRSHATGTITIPVSLILGGQLVSGYYNGTYNRSVISPSYQGALTHYYRHSSFTLMGGQSILPGNGTFLTSRDQFVSSLYSFSTRKSNVSFGGGFYRLESLANEITNTYTTGTFSASFGYNIAHYLSANIRYDYLHYGGLFTYGPVNEHRITAGLSLSSKSVPLSLY